MSRLDATGSAAGMRTPKSGPLLKEHLMSCKKFCNRQSRLLQDKQTHDRILEVLQTLTRPSTFGPSSLKWPIVKLSKYTVLFSSSSSSSSCLFPGDGCFLCGEARRLADWLGRHLKSERIGFVASLRAAFYNSGKSALQQAVCCIGADGK